MDYTQNLSDLNAASAAQDAVIAQATGVKAGIQAAIVIINAGYQADQATITAGIAVGVAAAVAPQKTADEVALANA